MVADLAYPFNIFRHVFADFHKSPFRITVTDEASAWLHQLAQENSHGPWTSTQHLLHNRDHRDLFFGLLQILLPSEFSAAVEELMVLDRSKWQYVDSQDFEAAAEAKRSFESKLTAIAQQVDHPTKIGREHLEQLFEHLRGRDAK